MSPPLSFKHQNDKRKQEGIRCRSYEEEGGGGRGVGGEERSGVIIYVMQKTIEEIFGRGKVPILVGGTHYFAYSLLWNTTIDKIELVEYPKRRNKREKTDL